MKYALYLDNTGRIQYVTPIEYAEEDMPLVDFFPEENTIDYQYIDGEYVYNPIIEELIEKPSKLEILEAKLTYIAMMTNTLDELEEIV